jgi:hypothetical protein
LSAQQISVLEILGPIPEPNSPALEAAIRNYLPLLMSKANRPNDASGHELGKNPVQADAWTPKWKMIFIWQCSIMFMSYSVCLFLAGLTLVVCTPLIRGDAWGGGSNVSWLHHLPCICYSDQQTAVTYLALCATGGTVFVVCSYWVYHYVDIEHVDFGVELPKNTDSQLTAKTLMIDPGPSEI